MTRWGLVLLLIFVALGLSPVDGRRATKYAVWAVAAVLLLVSVRNHSL